MKSTRRPNGPWFPLALMVSTLGLASCAGAPGPSPAPHHAAGSPHASEPEAHWDYGAARGPAVWASLSPSFAACGAGRRQSPVDFSGVGSGPVPAMRTSYTPGDLRIVRQEDVSDGINNGNTLQVNDGGVDTLTLGDDVFHLVQYHFHSPSEHTVDGKHLPMEMHLVHRSGTGTIAVLGVFLEEGAENPAFAPVLSNLPSEKGKEFHLAGVKADETLMLPRNRTTYRYDGSLTTPPCSEGVRWVVFTTPVQISAAQLGAFRAVLADTSRPTQPLNGRPVATDRVKERPES